MSSLFTQIRRRPRFAAAALLIYLALAGAFFVLVRRESDAWQARRQGMIEQSPVVWVAPYGIHYHQEGHYGRHLSSPLSLYEATERGYEYCNVCHPPPAAALIEPPAWVRHWGGALVALTCLWFILSVALLYKPRAASKKGRHPTADTTALM